MTHGSGYLRFCGVMLVSYKYEYRYSRAPVQHNPKVVAHVRYSSTRVYSTVEDGATAPVAREGVQ